MYCSRGNILASFYHASMMYAWNTVIDIHGTKGSFNWPTDRWKWHVLRSVLTWSLRLGSNPCSSMRNLRILGCPSLAALCRQVWACLSKSNLQGPNMGKRYFTTSKWPPHTARCRAFNWSCTQKDESSFSTYCILGHPCDNYYAKQTMTYRLCGQHICVELLH